ncbi:MAG: TonB-dependent receptor [Sideroxyarcus sp.]|nr:TonB-dependent receptor [Sideroxyarcus sp.]
MNTLKFQKPLRPCLLAVLLSNLACGVAVSAVVQADEATPLADYSLEQLMNVSVEVSSASRKPQKLEDTAAAIHVITRQDIRRSGMTSLPELLRMVPGMQVARIDSSIWAISSRGFNAKNSDNLLVMLDGRVLQTPSFTGVYWDAQDAMLEDVERIEVIRGPGGALWGANAVTGIINIITRSAAATQGGLLGGTIGNHERQGVARFGGEIGEAGHFRLYAKDAAQDNFKQASGIEAHDQRDMRSGGFRADWDLSGGNSLTVQGDTYTGGSDHTGTVVALTSPYSTPTGYTIALNGGNLLARWKSALSATDEMALQFYYDTYERRYFNLGEQRDTYDLDFQHHSLWNSSHDIVWGAGYRLTRDRMDNTFAVSYTPASRTDSVVSAFLQDEIALREDLHLIAGAKFEHNDYTGREIQPNLRLRWKIDERQTVWTAASRAVHTPSRTDANGQVVANIVKPGATVFVTRLQNNPAALSESVLSYEAGYRSQFSEQVQMDVSAFYSQHRDMMTIEREANFVEGAYTVIPLVFHNRASAITHGLEWSGTWRPDDKWQFKAAWSWLKMSIRRDANSTDTTIESEVGRSPQNQLQLHAFHSPSDNVDLSASLYGVDSLPSLKVPAYIRLDARIGWRIQHGLELSLTGHNLLDPGHPEFINPSGPRNSEIPRSILGGATWNF